MDDVASALVVDEPWISAILRGKKTWEMPRAGCGKRERVGLIRKGSGMVVGTATLVESLAPIESLADYAVQEHHHCIPPDRQAHAFGDGWRTPWVLRDAQPFPTVVPYDHPNGAVVWITLQPVVRAAIKGVTGAAGPRDSAACYDATLLRHDV